MERIPAKRLAMTHKLYHHLMGADRSGKSRVWFYAPGFNKALVIAAVRPAGHEHSVLRNRAISSPYKMLFRTLLAGLLAWFATWALLAIPVLSWYGVNAQKGVPLLETLSLQIGVGGGVAEFQLLAVGSGKNAPDRALASGGSNTLYPGSYSCI